MAFYVVTGKLGSGKSLVAVGRMKDYIDQGRKVATNLDLYLDELVPDTSTASVTRLPDKPRRADLDLLGTGDDRGIDEYDEERFGLLVLDECASWLNSRQWNDKERHLLIEWMLHARKNHWDVMLLIQDPDSLDKQMRQAFMEHLVVCKRLDKLAIPLVTTLTKMMPGPEIRMPKVHVARVYYGMNEQAALADRWVYRGTKLYKGYRTGQQFTNDELFTQDGEIIDMRASRTMLSAWHLRGRYMNRPSLLQRINRVLNVVYRPLVLRLVRASAASQGRSPWDVARSWGLIPRDSLPVVRPLAVRAGVLPYDHKASAQAPGGHHGS